MKNFVKIERPHKPFEHSFRSALCPSCGKILKNNGNGYYRCKEPSCKKEFVIFELTDAEERF